MKQKNLRSGRTAKAPERSRPRAARRSSSRSRPGLKIPAILFEGDQPGEPVMAGVGQKYALGPGPPGEQFPKEKEELPEAYGTGKVLLLAREPHWLYSHWDLTREQQMRYNARSIHHHLVLRVRAEGRAGEAAVEQHVHADSRSWFVPVTGAATSYVAELGYYRAEDKWVSIGSSSAVTTPSDAVSEDRTVQFSAMAPQMRAVALVEEGRGVPRRVFVQGELFQGGEAGEVASGFSGGVQGTAHSTWLAQEQAIAEESGLHEVAREQAGSIEIAELVRGQLEQRGPSGVELASVSSAWGGEQQRPKEFWLNVNTDLIIHGGTEPTARLTIDGQPIALRPDGTFSCRLALPDGEYEAVIEAVSLDGEARRVRLRVLRRAEGE